MIDKWFFLVSFSSVALIALGLGWEALNAERRADEAERNNALLLARLREIEAEWIRAVNKLAGGDDE